MFKLLNKDSIGGNPDAVERALKELGSWELIAPAPGLKAYLSSKENRALETLLVCYIIR